MQVCEVINQLVTPKKNQQSLRVFADGKTMDVSFHKTFSPVLKVIAFAGLYFPGSDVLYPKYATIVRYLTYLMFVNSLINYVMEAVNEFMFIASSRAEGMTDLFMVMALGVISPTYSFIVYSYWRLRDMEEIIEIWEEEMTHPPFPEDRKAEIANNQKYLFKIVKVEVYGFIVPFTIWSSRTLFTYETVLPIVYSGDIAASPAYELVTLFFGYFGYCVAVIWCAAENVKLVFMKSILGELNHLYTAAEKILTFKANNEVYEADPDKRKKELPVMEQNLKSWIIYHQTVLRFSAKINTFMAPMILLQDIAALVFAFSNVFVLTMGNVPLYNWLSGTIYLIFYYYVMYVTNSLGDEIRTKSATIFDTFSGREYFWYSKAMIKDIIFIQYIATHRPITLKATWYKSLSRKSLGELSSRGYEIITFMRHLIKRTE